MIYHLVTIDTCYVLSFSIIMLNTGLHNPNVKDKVRILEYAPYMHTLNNNTQQPSIEKFIMMNKGLDNGQDLPHELLTVWDNVILLILLLW